MLRTALNALLSIHSRTATLRRPGSPDIFSPCKIGPSNFFRSIRGPEYTTISGSEFIIPVDSMKGQFAQLLEFSAIPDAGQFKLQFGMNTTANFLNYDATAADIQTELRLIAPLANVIVTGSFSLGFTVTFPGYQVATGLGQVVSSTLGESSDPVTGAFSNTYTPWSQPIRKGDKILDGGNSWTIDEIIHMHDLGAQVMAYRVRCDE